MNWQVDGEPKPAILVLPPAAVSLDEANAAIELWEHYKRRKLDPAQRLTVQVMMATRGDGLWAAPTTGREESRQNGKGDEVEVVEFWGLVQRAERILHTIHDAVLLATEAQSRLLSLIDGHADLRRLKARAWRGTGQQMIEMRNGGIIWYRTRTGGGARGVDEVDRIVVDEAQHAEEEHLAAITPTQLASANPQLNAMGSAGIVNKSHWWWRLRKRAASNDPGDLGYVGHAAEEIRLDSDGRVVRSQVDPHDRAMWRRANPALCAGRVSEAFFEEQIRRLGPDLFAREHLTVWDPDPDDVGGSSVMPRWSELADRDSRIVSNDAWAVSVSPVELGAQWASFGVAGRRADGRFHVESLEHRAGTWWIVDRARERQKEIGGRALRVPSTGPTAAFIDQLRAGGVVVEEVSAGDVSRATGALVSAANQLGTVDDNGNERPPGLHHVDQPSLNKAVHRAVSKTSAAGATSWDELRSTVEITPLIAVTIALGGVAQEIQRAPRIWSLASTKAR